MATINSKTFAQDTDPTKDSRLYKGPGHTFSTPDILVVKRVDPKPSKTSNGVHRVSAKFTRGVSVAVPTGGTAVAPAIVEVSGAFPVGMTSTEVNTILADAAALAGSADMQQLANTGDLTLA